MPFVRAAAATALGAYAVRPEVQAALIQLLDDRKEGPRVSAVEGLVGARPSADVLRAVLSREPATPSEGYTMAKTVLLLVQQGEQHWPVIAAGLGSKHRYERVAWWRLLRRGLDLPAYMHDAAAAPDAARVRRLDRTQVLAALKRRASAAGSGR